MKSIYLSLILIGIILPSLSLADDISSTSTLRCAQSGLSPCQIELGKAYAYGHAEWGVEQNYETALHWLRLATEGKKYGPNTEALSLIEAIEQSQSSGLPIENFSKTPVVSAIMSPQPSIDSHARPYLTQTAPSLHSKYCRGDWLKIPTTCFSYQLGKAGVPKSIAMIIVYSSLALIAVVITVTAYTLLRRLSTLKKPFLSFTQSRTARRFTGLYVMWALFVIFTDNFAFRNGLKHWEFDNDEGVLYLILLPLFALVGLIIWHRLFLARRNN